MEPWGRELSGRLEELWIDSAALTGNPLGDPHRRPLLVQTPAAYQADAHRRFPVIFVLQGLTNQVDMWRNRRAFQPTTPEAVDAVFAGDDAPPTIVVYVDAWTSLGGSQFVDSPGTGRYQTYLCDEVVPFVDDHFRTLAAPAHRAVAGHSSGGCGAMVSAMRRPDLFGALATHAGDALFEVSLLPDVGEAVRALRDGYAGSYDAFWAAFRSRQGRWQRGDGELLNLYCMAACYSTDLDGTVRLPFDLATGRLDPETWERWLANDPVRMVPSHAEALRSLHSIWIDAGRGDEHHLDLGAEAFRAALAAIDVTEPVVRFELHQGGHSGNSWRYPLAIAWLANRLSLDG